LALGSFGSFIDIILDHNLGLEFSPKQKQFKIVCKENELKETNNKKVINVKLK
jgi:hypothetical protein